LGWLRWLRWLGISWRDWSGLGCFLVAVNGWSDLRLLPTAFLTKEVINP